MRVEVGSTAHGTGLPGKEDYDELGVMTEPWECSIGLKPGNDTIVYRPGRRPDERSQPGDYDLQVYTARKFCALAVKGNPSILMMLFGPLRYSTPLGDELRALAPAFWSQQARYRFLGYAQAQRMRLEGLRGGAHTNRPELIAEHGYDTKYAMHMLRLCLQGYEYMMTGKIELPMWTLTRADLHAVRRGEWTLPQVLDAANYLEHQLENCRSEAPMKPDLASINEWLLKVHLSTLPAAMTGSVYHES